MDKNQSEIFCEFTYPESMTYEDLIEYEKLLIDNLDSLFRDSGAEHLDFTPLGDILMMQCAFEIRNLELLRDVAGEIALILPKGMSGRIFCLEKNLVSCHIFWIKKGQWQEKEYQLPVAAPEDAPVHKVN